MSLGPDLLQYWGAGGGSDSAELTSFNEYQVGSKVSDSAQCENTSKLHTEQCENGLKAQRK